MSRVLVVGAGVGGMCAAVRLAKLGHQITVLERADAVGGKLGRFSRDGFAFDTGPHLLTLPAVLRDTFRKSGRPLERELEIVPVEPACHYRFADGSEVDVPGVGVHRVVDAFGDAFGGAAADDWRRFAVRAKAMWAVSRGPFLENALTGADLLRLSRRVGDLRTMAPWQTLRALGRSHLRDPRLRTYLDRYATYSGSDPRRAPAALATVPYVEQTFGCFYVPGGLYRIAEALQQRMRVRKVDLRLDTEVASLSVDGGRVTGAVLADGQMLTADVVVADADAADVYGRLLDPRLPAARSARRRLAAATPSLAGFVLLLALRGRTPGLRHHTVLFPADYDDEFDSVFGTRSRAARPTPDPAVYLSGPDDPATRPSADTEASADTDTDTDTEAVYVLVNAPRHGDPAADSSTVDWRAPGVADAYADRVLAVMAARGVDVRDRVLWREIRTPADLADRTAAPGGAIYGTSSNGARSAFLRAANASPVPGLFCVGGSAHPGGGLPLVGLSAKIVADAIGPA